MFLKPNLKPLQTLKTLIINTITISTHQSKEIEHGARDASKTHPHPTLTNNDVPPTFKG